jgi:hypothetical protein
MCHCSEDYIRISFVFGDAAANWSGYGWTDTKFDLKACLAVDKYTETSFLIIQNDLSLVNSIKPSYYRNCCTIAYQMLYCWHHLAVQGGIN